MCIVDKRLEQKISEKIQEALSSAKEIDALARQLDPADGKSFRYGILVGRLYNSFYYQSRRILKRDPTEEEFAEFLRMLAKRRGEFLEKI